MNHRVALLLMALAGCQAKPLGPYVAPRVTGRVLAADTHQAVAGAKVNRGRPEATPLAGFPPKGGELLLRKSDILTDHEGRFVLPSERVLTLFRWGGWSMVRLSVEHGGYQRFQTNYAATNLVVTNLSGGEPVLDAGEILLKPSRK
jgi:hypothetical protein